jgi:hypothetical protein
MHLSCQAISRYQLISTGGRLCLGHARPGAVCLLGLASAVYVVVVGATLGDAVVGGDALLQVVTIKLVSLALNSSGQDGDQTWQVGSIYSEQLGQEGRGLTEAMLSCRGGRSQGNYQTYTVWR